MDVGNRWGILGAGSLRKGPRRVERVFAGLGDDSGDDAPPIDENPGAPGSDESTDQGSGGDNSPPVNPQISPVTANPGEPITAQSDPNAGQNTSSSGGGGGGGNNTAPAGPEATDYTPWIIGGALVLGAGAAGVWYLRHRKKLHRR